MRSMGVMLLSGAAAIVIWKIFAALFIGLLGMVLKVALVVGLVVLAMRFFQNQKRDEEMAEPGTTG